ncbi:MAG TPA: biotin-dependent carboxyltransferase family protein [Polyangia bacterium]
MTVVSAPALEIVRAGMLTTIQDLGRPGLGRFGVSPSGPMDPFAHRLANALVGNPPSAAALEITGPGTVVRFLRAQRFAIAGADLAATLDDVALPRVAVVTAKPGARLSFGARRSGARVSLACAGGWNAPLWFASAATDVGAAGPLRAGTTLHAFDQPRTIVDPDNERLAALGAFVPLPPPNGPCALRYVPEPEGGVTAAAAAAFALATFRVSPRSNRTGFRFEGAALATVADPARLSEPTAPGAIQLPPDGHPILLMADRNTTGGYPRLGHLCGADRGRAAQLWPGDEVRFFPIDATEAHALTRAALIGFSGLLTSGC